MVVCGLGWKAVLLRVLMTIVVVVGEDGNLWRLPALPTTGWMNGWMDGWIRALCSRLETATHVVDRGVCPRTSRFCPPRYGDDEKAADVGGESDEWLRVLRVAGQLCHPSPKTDGDPLESRHRFRRAIPGHVSRCEMVPYLRVQYFVA